MRLTLLQTEQNVLYNFPQSDLRFSRTQALFYREQMIEQTFALMDEAPPSDLIVTTEAINFPGQPAWLEGDYPGHCPSPDDPLFERLSAQAKRHNSYLVACCYVRRGGRVYNEALVYDRQGTLRCTYDKVHLAGGERTCLDAGDQFCVVQADFGTFGVCICWDMQFPETCRELALMGADLVVCPTWGWEGIYGHARAYENGIFVASAMAVPYWMPIQNQRNPSEVIGPEGRVLAAAVRDSRQCLSCELVLADCHPFKTLRMGDRRPQAYRLTAKKV